MEIRQVQYFLAIVRVGSFSEAAEDLYVSQSWLSKQMISLEKELGCVLFDRSKRQIVITEAGQVFYDHAQKMVMSLIRLDEVAQKKYDIAPP